MPSFGVACWWKPTLMKPTLVRPDFEFISRILLRALILAILILAFWFLAFWLAGDWMLDIHSYFLGMDATQKEEFAIPFKLLNYGGMMAFKLTAGLAFLVPWLAIRWTLKSGGPPGAHSVSRES